MVRGRSDTGELSRKITEQKCSRAEYCDERVCVFLCQRAYLQNYTPDLQEIFACVNFLFRLFLNYSVKIFTEDNTLRKKTEKPHALQPSLYLSAATEYDGWAYR